MSKFSRSFDVAVLAAWDKAHPGNAVRALFSRWCLPGVENTGPVGLRVGLRDKYVNFYAKGQSVAKLSIRRGLPRVEVHQAYVVGTKRNRSVERIPNAQAYRSFEAEDLASPEVVAQITQWVEVAETYASAEKRFVDDLVSSNAGAIDLEMALPANVLPNTTPVAPRMDLVMAQIDGEGQLSLAFWEAKCATNPELRANNHEPRVRAQLEKYVAWVRAGNRLAEVQEAYSNTGRVFLELYRHFCGDEQTSECGRLWRALAEDKSPPIVSRPGIVVGNYWPYDSDDEVAADQLRRSAMSFTSKGHRKALEDSGFRVHEVGPAYESAVLPLLAESKVTA